ncbi:aldehyde dehydrogenase family protein [Niabella ginsengisoli]|uniref:Acyl-CoA reductase n=1 Tax=Niabella ginsengisoli TaxID=522298 RepID=A0ABS9SKA5_9BACT|nr:acyl-CoA reductase [Niabella ginsengisoli]MCH5598822.1 acyl-CoA reductase [Niabella ginsengisoli]
MKLYLLSKTAKLLNDGENEPLLKNIDMNLSKRIDLMAKLGQYMQQNSEDWQEVKEKAYSKNGWFLPEFIELSINNIVNHFLQKSELEKWIALYPKIKEQPSNPKLIGIVMAGNIPLVGFHDFLCVFISGHRSLIKPSSKDEVLIKHLVEKLIEWEASLKNFIGIADMLKNCDAYIATGSNSTAGYFDYYFGKFPNIIRRNRTSVAVLTGHETDTELDLLADDVYQYFGMGCRNITKLYVPKGYDFLPLINIFKRYEYLADHHKYKNNYDYNLALHILNNKVYMSNAALLLIDDKNIFSPVSQLHYEEYDDINQIKNDLQTNESIQCIVGKEFISFGAAQHPGLTDYADGIDTMKWLESLS